MGHVLAALALAVAAGLVGFILAGGEPFGQVVGTPDVSAPTAPAVQSAPARPVKARLRATSPFKARTAPLRKPPRRHHRTPRPKPAVVQVVAPPPAEYSAPVATPAPVPPASKPPTAPSGGGKPQQRWASAQG
jgi:hypothetical protein